MSQHYQLKCSVCGYTFADDGISLACPREHEPGLLITEYVTKAFAPDRNAPGIARYWRWLPSFQISSSSCIPITYQSERLNRALGLPNLWIAFSGYWPERGSEFATGTFKELEARSVVARVPHLTETLVVASAGSTAAAFAHVCSQQKLSCLIIVPARGLARMRLFEPLHPCVRVISLTGRADYSDAISLAERLSQLDGFILEGGVKNVGRRDGIGTILLSAVEAIGHLPDCYFQAIGSGAGGIATYEMSQRLIGDGRFGCRVPQLMLSQNLPFAPIYRAWKGQSPTLDKENVEMAKQQAKQIVADVLSNRQPPYAIRGGIVDVLTASDGNMLAATNRAACRALNWFHRCEGIDIDPAAGVALASLIDAASQGKLNRDATILLHLTGGGFSYRQARSPLDLVKPTLELDVSDIGTERSLEQITALFS